MFRSSEYHNAIEYSKIALPKLIGRKSERESPIVETAEMVIQSYE